MSGTIFTPLQEFYCQKVLPVVYGNSLSYLEELEKLKDSINTMITTINANVDTHDALADEYAQVLTNLKTLTDQIDLIKKGNYLADGSINVSKMDESFTTLLQSMITDTLGNAAQFVSFGLDDNGYFYAGIPTNWSSLVFSTDTEGHLVLEF